MSRSPTERGLGEGETLCKHFSGFSRSEEGDNQWLRLKVVQCGKAIGVTMEESKGGWASLMDFARSKGKQNQTRKSKRNAKRKGGGELNGLRCSINYDKAKDQEIGDNAYSKSGRKNKGASSGYK
eukprot:TRINITY_DN17438_c0_g1_i1.p1 TRINITY_DN17438_c0_g1~~TRINITY_DN17438_c0_g1_i1.p1  ORF type:complete len:125 (+),score=25.82 TRINITY_DN17438_c0_g1_i1:476-850(+)